MRRKIYLAIALCLFVVSVLLAGEVHWAYSGVGGRAWAVDSLIAIYISENGCYPANQEALIEANVLRVEQVENGFVYYTRTLDYDSENPDDSGNWKERNIKLDMFGINYGSDLSNVIISDSQLIDKKTNLRYSLITGPYDSGIYPLLRQTYNKISVRWYKEWLKHEK